MKKDLKKYSSNYVADPAKMGASDHKIIYIINVDSAYVGGGSAFVNSISILLNEKPAPAKNASTTSGHHILIHEIGHLWNGVSLKQNDDMEWFSEGVTDYLAYRIEYELQLLIKRNGRRLSCKKI